MPLRVKEIAEVIEEEVICDRRVSEAAALLTNQAETTSSEPGPAWAMHLTIGEGQGARNVTVEMGRFLSRDEYESSDVRPIFLPPGAEATAGVQLAFFRHKIFSIEPPPRNAAMRDEAILRMKRHVYAQDAEVASLKSYVANIEAAVAYQSGPRREPIPDDVKIVVWARDGGACTRCGSKSQLQFDHIIPVAKGGASTAENIQLFCMPCNLRKSDRIAF